MQVERKKTFGFKPILISPENHKWLTSVTSKSQIINDTISELLKDKLNVKVNVNAIAQIHLQVSRPEGSMLPATKRKRDPSPDG